MDHDGDPCDYNWMDELGGPDEFEKFWEYCKKKSAIREYKKIKKLQLAKIHRSLERLMMRKISICTLKDRGCHMKQYLIPRKVKTEDRIATIDLIKSCGGRLVVDHPIWTLVECDPKIAEALDLIPNI